MQTITYRFPGSRVVDDYNELRAYSTAFPRDVVYEFRDDNVIIYTRNNGILSAGRRELAVLASELAEMAEVWGGIRT